jgi:hypothetical protein
VNEAPYPAAPAHDAYPAPPAWRPMSAMAVLSLVLAILLGFVALIGVWWVEILPLLLGIFALGATGAQRKRGRGLAIAGIVVAAAGGTYAFAMHRSVEIVVERHLDGLIGALDRGDGVQVARYVAESAKDEERTKTWILRAAVAKERLGAYSGQVTVGNVFFGIVAAILPPQGVDEVEPRGADVLDVGEALWARVKYQKGDAWFAFGFGDAKEASAAVERLKEAKEDSFPPWVHDVRVYLPRAGSDDK